jgi:hypothetical protein
MSEEIKQFVGDFLVETSKTSTPQSDKFGEALRHNWIENPHWEDTAACHNLCKKIEGQLTRAIDIADAMMQWETPADARKTSKDLSDLKKEINEITN